jgi:hypothetical protein
MKCDQSRDVRPELRRATRVGMYDWSLDLRPELILMNISLHVMV